MGASAWKAVGLALLKGAKWALAHDEEIAAAVQIAVQLAGKKDASSGSAK